MQIVASAPSRISLFGGGSDTEPYASEHEGLVINMAINLRSRVTLFTDDDIWSHQGVTVPLNADPALFYKISEEYGMNTTHLRTIKSKFDGIVGAGLGSSASASVALIGAFQKYKGLPIDQKEIAQKAWDIEVNKMGWYGGKQDQWASSFGGFNAMEIFSGVKVVPLPVSWVDKLYPHMILFYTGGQRNSRIIQEGFKTLTSEKKSALDELKKISLASLDALGNGDIREIGFLLDKTWKMKKKSNKEATSEKIDMVYNTAKEYVWGGKVLGAGGCGYMLFIGPVDKRKKLIEAMLTQGVEEVDFQPDFQGVEARIL